MPITLFTALAHVCTYVRGAFGLEKLNNHNNQNNFTMRKFTLFFAALLVVLGITAQTTTYPEGYFDFATEYLTMEECGQGATFQDGMLIAIQHDHSFHSESSEMHDHEGKFLMMETMETYGVHKLIMYDHLSGLGAFTLVEADGGFKLKAVRDGHWVGILNAEYDALKTTKDESRAGIYNFVWHEGYGYSFDCVNSSSSSSSSYSLYVNTKGGTVSMVGGPYPTNDRLIDEEDKLYEQLFFKVYQVSNPKGVTKYVENAKVELTGPGGNVFTTTHSGWSDFYEFVQNSSVYGSTYNFGVTLSNVMYHEATNEITGNIHFPFPVSGDVVKIPVVLNPATNADRRIAANAAGDGLEVQTKPANGWVQNLNNQWGIIPHFVNGFYLEYAIQNVATGTYITVDASNNVTLGTGLYYFDLTGGTSDGKITDLRFKKKNATQYLYDNNGTVGMNYYASEGAQFKVDRVPANELSGEEAKGFTRHYKDKLFWDCGAIDWSKAPKALLAALQDGGHEGYDQGGHTLYSAETGCRVPKTGDITVTFNYSSGTHMLQILGVDVVAANGTVLNSDYHVGKAGNPSANNKYTIKDIPAGENYTVRYWVCDYSNGHDLTKNQGNIKVTGADYYVKYSNAPANGAWAANTTWFRMRLFDTCERYISAQPAYMDADNYLKLTNNTPPTDYAGMWAIVGDATNGYKFYNHAWGPEYALKTTGSEGGARTFMAPVAEATTYDIVSGVKQDYEYQFFVKVHGSTNNYLNKRGDYLALWDSTDGLGDQGSVMTFETVDMEAFEANTTAIKENLSPYWQPWLVMPEIETIYNDFASLMKNRNNLFSLLDGKVFKFVNKAGNTRNGHLLGVNASNKGAGLAVTNTTNDYLQFINNGDGTFKLYHIATGRYLGVPDGAVTTTNASEAASYTYIYQSNADNNKQRLTFVTSGQTLHLQNSLELMNYGSTDSASWWEVAYGDEAAQELGEVATEAQALLAEINSEAYQANIGLPGTASAEAISQYATAVQSLSGKSVADAKAALQTAMQAVDNAEKVIYFPTDCYFTITNKEGRGSVVYNPDATYKDGEAHYLWSSTALDNTNVNHLWGFFKDPATGEYYLYNVGAKLFAAPTGEGTGTPKYGSRGDTWVFSNEGAAITLEAMTSPYFHIQGDGKTMSISNSYKGPVITYYKADDGGVPFRFEKSSVAVDPEVTAAIQAVWEAGGGSYLETLAALDNTNIYGISCQRGPLAYVAGNDTHLSTPAMGASADVAANVKGNVNEQFAILRTENTRDGWYYLYSIAKQAFVSKDFSYSATPVCAVNFRDIKGNNAEYPWEVWFGDETGDTKLNVNTSAGVVLDSWVNFDAGNCFRIEYAETNVEKTAAALEAIVTYEAMVAERNIATEFLNAAPQGAVGYPTDAERKTLQDALDNATTAADVTTALQAFKETASVNMPESGKAYVFTNVHHNGAKHYLNYTESGLTLVARGEAAANTLPASAKWYCRKLEDGRYVFVNNAGKYLVWRGKNVGANGTKGYLNEYETDWCPLTFDKMVNTGTNTGNVSNAELFGYMAFGGKREEGKNSYFITTWSADGTTFNQDGGWTMRYKASNHSTAFLVEEVSNYVLANTKLTTVTENDGLLTGIEAGQTIGTFSAPYATVIPDGVTAYYAKSAEKAGMLNLKAVEGGVLPAGEGVVLIGESANVAQMLPVAGETVTELEEGLNQFANSATDDVVLGDNAYILSKTASEGIGIYKAAAGGKLQQGKAYLDFSASTVARFVLNFSGVTTDIEGAPTVAPSQQVIYDLSGRRVNAVTKGGIYIVNGKKMIIK